MKYLYILFLVIVSHHVQSQCGTKKAYAIDDLSNEMADTTNVSILVNGAINNDLSSVAQGLCGVKLKFKHPFMKELFIELISPSGQKITLVGGDIVATNTQLITWDVTFVPGSATAAPDLGFLDRWENDQLWQNLTTYTGQYYPYQGDLENFNIGTVNGTWTLRCIDFEDEGTGNLLSAQLIFCQDQGVFCGECLLQPGVINNPDLIACEGDQSLLVNLNKTFPNNDYNDDNYDYSNIIFKDSTIVIYTQNPDLRSLSPGTYTICGTQISKQQAPAIFPPIGAQYNEATLNEHFFVIGACAAVGTECMQVVIQNKTSPTNISEYICKGESFVVDGRSYQNEGIYNIVIENGACDSLVRLDLHVIDIVSKITADRDSISCSANTVGLIGENIGTSVQNINYFWFTLDGKLSGNTNDFIVDAVKEGTYFLELTAITPEVTCKDTISKTIFPDLSFPNITFAADTITCLKDTVDISASISQIANVHHWSTKEGLPFNQNGLSISVWQPGYYYLTVTGNNGCTVTDSILIHQDKIFDPPTFILDTLDCKKDSVHINTMVNSARNFKYEWVNIGLPYKYQKDVVVGASGIYTLMLTDIKNGCSGSFDAEVIENKVLPKILNIRTDTINCLQSSVVVDITADQVIEKYLWQGPQLNTTVSSPEIFFDGNYSVTVTSASTGCTSIAHFEILKDTLVPILTISVDSISCLKDSVQLILSSTIPLTMTQWSGPFGFQSKQISPFAFREGQYSVDVVSQNGCMGKGIVDVFKSTDIPNIDLISDSLRCGKDTINLKLLGHKADYNYQWQGPGLLSNNVAQPLINASGTYTVTVTNIQTGCTDEEEVEIVDDRIYTIPSISVEELNCSRDSVQIVLTNTDIQSITYTGPAGFNSSIISPFVHDVGTYYFTILNNRNCITFDSINVFNNDEIPILGKNVAFIQCKQDSFPMMGISSIEGTEFTWNGPMGYVANGTTVYATEGGDYTLQGLAPNGCKSELKFIVGYDTLSPIFNILPFDTITCLDSLATLQTDFGTDRGEVMWLPTGSIGQQITVSKSGQYTAVATGKNNCTTSKTVSVLENRIFPTYLTLSTVINCKDSLSNISISPTSSYTSLVWNNATNPSQIMDGQLSVTTKNIGFYYFTFENQEGCISKGSVEVQADTLHPKINAIIIDTISCTNKTASIGVTSDQANLQYNWNGPGLNDINTSDGIMTVDKGGKYRIVVKSQNFCADTAYIDVVTDNDLPKYTTFLDTLTCDKGKVNIGVVAETQGLTYEWVGPQLFMSNIRNPKVFIPGTYTLTMTAPNGCKVEEDFVVIENIKIPDVIISDTILLPCDSSAIELKVESDQDIKQYNWVFANSTLHTIANPMTNITGNYTIQIASVNGCASAIKRFYVGINTASPLFTVVTDTITCSQPMANLSVNSPEMGTTFQWQSPSGIVYLQHQVITNEAGKFILFVTNQQKCKDSIIINVGLDTLMPQVVLVKSGALQCRERQVFLEASNPTNGDTFSAKWQTSDGNIVARISDYRIEVDQSGKYQFLLTNIKNGCVLDTIIAVNDDPQQFTILNIDTIAPICPEIKNGVIHIKDLNGVSPYNIEINGDDKNGQQYFNNLWAGNYYVKVTDSLGCTQERQVSVPVPTDLLVGIEQVISIKFGDSILLQPILSADPTGTATLSWYKRDSLLCTNCPELWVRPFVNTYYTLVYDIGGLCTTKVDVLIKVKNDIDKSIPNMFRPGSSHENDIFYIPQTRGIEKVIKLLVFDRWAENVFQAHNFEPGQKSNGWDGNFNQKPCLPGVYVVIAELLLSDGSVWIYKGDLTLLR